MNRSERRFKSQQVVIPFLGAQINQIVAYDGWLYRCVITESDFVITDFKNEVVTDIKTIIAILQLVKQNLEK